MPAAVGTQHTSPRRAASIANAVEELQNLNSAFSAQPDRIAIVRGLDPAALLVESAQFPSQRANAVPVVEEIVHHLVYLMLHHALAQHQPDLVVVGSHLERQISHPRRIETSRGQGGLQLLRQL